MVRWTEAVAPWSRPRASRRRYGRSTSPRRRWERTGRPARSRRPPRRRRTVSGRAQVRETPRTLDHASTADPSGAMASASRPGTRSMPSPGSMTRVGRSASHPAPGSPLGPRRACRPARRRPGWPTRRSCVRSWRAAASSSTSPACGPSTCWRSKRRPRRSVRTMISRTAGSRTAQLVGDDDVPPAHAKVTRHAVGRPLRKGARRSATVRVRSEAAVRPDVPRARTRIAAEPGLVARGRPSAIASRPRGPTAIAGPASPRRWARACRWRSAAIAARATGRVSDRHRERSRRTRCGTTFAVGDDRLTQQRHAATPGARRARQQDGPARSPLAQRSTAGRERREQVPVAAAGVHGSPTD